jgi:hypothetical protein
MAKNDTLSPTAFLTRLGVSASDIPESGPMPCPLHPETGFSLSYRRSEVLPGRVMFSCNRHGCGFSGSMFDLAAAALKKDMKDIFKMFDKDGPLYNTLLRAGADPLKYRAMLDTAMVDSSQQHELRRYIDKCRGRLKTHTLLATQCEKFGIKEDALRLLPAGMLLHPAPECLRELDGKEYGKNDEYLVLPYTMDGMITAVGVRHPGTNEGRIHYVPGLPPYGVFMEESMNKDDRSKIMLTSNEMDAMALFAKSSDLTLTRISPVTLLSPGSLGRLKGVTVALAVGHLGSRISLPAMLELGRNEGVDIRVVSLGTELVNMVNTVIPGLHASSTPMLDWAANELKRVASESSEDAAACLVVDAMLPDGEKHRLLKALVRAGMKPETVAAIRSAAAHACDIKYGETTIRRTSQGYWLRYPEVKRLTNFILYLSSITQDSGGNKFMNCVVQPDTDQDKTCTVEIPFNKMSTGHALAEHLTIEMGRQNCDFKPWAEALPSKSINNYRLLAMQFDKIRYEEQSGSLGVYGGTITYPRVKADPDLPDARSSGIVRGLCPEAVQQYAGVAYSNTDPRPVLASLLTTDNMAVAAFTGTIAHMLQQTVAAYCNPGTYVPRHLILPNALRVSSMWSGLMRQAYSVPAGTGEGMLFVRDSASDIRNAHSTLDSLNRLPAMVQCMENGDEIVNLTKRARSSLVILAQSRTADKLNAGNGCYFSREDVSLLETMTGPVEVPETIVEELRAGWVPMLRMMISGMRQLGKRLVTEPLPAIQACEFLAKECGVTLSPVYGETFTRFFTDEGVNTPVPFLLDLKDILDSGSHTIAANAHDARAGNAKRSLGYRIDGGVVVFKVKAMKLVSAKDIYNTDHLTEEMRKEGMLMQDPAEQKSARRDYWVFTEETWKRYVDIRIDMMPEFNDPQVVMIRTAC